MRSGAQTLSLLSHSRNCAILRSLAEGPKRQMELRHAAGLPAPTTLRSLLRSLEDIGVIARRRKNAFPGTHEYELEQPGRELLLVADSLTHWLADAPDGPLALGGDSAKAVVQALIEGWSSTVLRAIAARPLSLTELDRIIGDLSYPSLERRLAAMRLAGQIEPSPRNGRGTPYAATSWLRRGVGPLIAASRWERLNLPATTPAIGRIDVEASLLLSVPLVRLPDTASGTCRLAMELRNGEVQFAGVTAEAREGKIVSCTARLQDDAGSWAAGTSIAWFRAVFEADPDHLELGGDSRFARLLLEGLNHALFGA